MSDFQSRSSRVGRAYEDQVSSWLIEHGFTIDLDYILHESAA